MTSVTADIEDGTLVCGEAGQALSGTVEDDGPVIHVTGGDLKVRNPASCVGAGLLPKTELRNYEGAVSDDGRTVDVVWERQFLDFEYDNGALVACPRTYVTESSFSIHRLVFGPDLPF